MLKRGRYVAGRVALAALLLTALAGQAESQINATMPLYQIHGSGTSNPALIIWRVMDTMMARTKPKIAMSYRSIGSGAGGDEFTNSTSAFGCGDVPITKENFNTILTNNDPMMHVPFLVGSVSIFHNIPGIGKGLFLPPCTLARIFRGNITKWSDNAIIERNPHLPDLKNTDMNITVVHRISGSSSTYALTHYLSRACASEWNGPVGVTTKWPDDEPGRWVTVKNSQGMVEKVASSPYSLGYVESGQGLLAGLQEVEILNANQSQLTSSDAEIAPESLITSQFPLDNLATSDWTDVNPVYASSSVSTKQWPLTLGTYFYVRKDLTKLGEAGGLLKIFLQYMLSDDVATLMLDYGFIALPKEIRTNLSKSLDANLVVADKPIWSMETDIQKYGGQRDFVFSLNRDSYVMNTVLGLSGDTKEAKNTLKLGDAYQVHGSGSFVSALAIRHAMQVLQSRSRVPVTMTYRTVGTVEAQREFNDPATMYRSYNHFKVGDMPLDTATWSGLNTAPTPLTTISAVVQLPFAISALGVYHSKSFGRPALALNCELLASLYSGTLRSWNDTALLKFNSATISFADQGSTASITVFAMAPSAPSGSTFALTGYLAKACPSNWTLTPGPLANVTWPEGVTTTFKGESITTPEQMLAAIAGTPNAIGYLPATLGGSSSLYEAQLEVKPGANGSTPRLTTTKTANLIKIVDQSNKDFFNNLTADLASKIGSDLYDVPDTWPIPMVQYLYMYRNLSGYGYSGPLLRAFVEFLIPGTQTGEGSRLILDASLTPMPDSIQQTVRKAVAAVTLKTLTVNWNSEAEGLVDSDAGAGLYTFSANRMSYDAYELESLRSALDEVQAQLPQGLLTVVRVACTADTFGYVRLLRGDLQDMANSPIRILDEMGSAPEVISMLLATLNGSATATPTQLVVHPGPLTTVTWQRLSLSAPIVQIPISIRPVAVLYKGDPGLRLRLCTLAKILIGNITHWNDTQITADNPTLLTNKSNITLLVASSEDGDVTAMLEYIKAGSKAAGCPEYAQGLQLTASAVIASDALTRLASASASRYSELALLAASNLVADDAAGAGLQAAALPSSKNGTFVTPLQSPSTINDSACAISGCPDRVGQSYTAAVEEAASWLSKVPVVSGDWSAFSLGPLNGRDVYPVARFDYLVLPADLTKYGSNGAVLQGIVKYALHETFMSRTQRALSPYFNALGPKARSGFSDPEADALTVALGLPVWSVVRTSADQVDDTSTTIVLARAPSVFDVALSGSLADSLATATVAKAAAVSSAVNSSLKEAVASAVSNSIVEEAVKNAVTQNVKELEALKQTTADNQRDVDKLNRTYNIAVAAIVLAIILSVLSLALTLYVLVQVRRGGGGGGYFNASGTARKYDQQLLDGPVSQIEMQRGP